MQSPPLKFGESAEFDVSVIVPMYQSADRTKQLIDRLHRLQIHFPSMEAVLVVDGLVDGTLEVLQSLLPEAAFASQVVVHTRNFGANAAVRTGLGCARGMRHVCMADDLQEPESLIIQLLDELDEAQYDVAVGTRSHRHDPMRARTAARLFWLVQHRFFDSTIPRRGVDVFACTRQVTRELLKMGESRTSLVGLLFWIGYRRVEVPYVRQRRISGSSGWTLRRRVSYALDSTFGFSSAPITFLVVGGLLGSAFSLIASTYLAFSRLSGRIDVSGYTTLIITMLASTFLLLLGLGIVGSYAWRAFENSKHRPDAVVMIHRNFDSASDCG